MKKEKCIMCSNSLIGTTFKKYCSLECFEKSKIKFPKTKCEILNCKQCGKLVLKNKSEIKNCTNIFCTNSCSISYTAKRRIPPPSTKIKTNCAFCNKEILITRAKMFGKNKTNKHFCNGICAGKHVGMNSKMLKQSLLEKYIFECLKLYFPYLEILPIDRTVLNGLEIDIYLPDLNFGIEINGSFHYKQIFTEKSFKNIQKRDILKKDLCLRKGIQLLIVDNLKSFKIIRAEKIWNEVVKPIILKMIPYCENQFVKETDRLAFENINLLENKVELYKIPRKNKSLPT